MTTVEKVLLDLEYLTKEQEEELTFFALDEVIDAFNIVTDDIFYAYSDEGIPLVKDFDLYLDKQDGDEDTDTYPIRRYRERLQREQREQDQAAAQERIEEQTARERRRITDPTADAPDIVGTAGRAARGAAEATGRAATSAAEATGRAATGAARKLRRDAKAEYEAWSTELESLKDSINIGTNRIKNSLETSEQEVRNFVADNVSGIRNKGRQAKVASMLMGGMLANKAKLGASILDGTPVRGNLYPTGGIRYEGKHGDAMNIQLNRDRRTFNISIKSGPDGTWEDLPGGSNISSFGDADRLIRRKMISEARKAGEVIGPDPRSISGNNEADRRKKREALKLEDDWFDAKGKDGKSNLSIRSRFPGIEKEKGGLRRQQTKIGAATEDTAKLVSAYSKNTFDFLKNNGFDPARHFAEAAKYKGYDFLEKVGPSAREIPALIASKPWSAATTLIEGIRSGTIKSLPHLNNIVKRTGTIIAKSAPIAGEGIGAGLLMPALGAFHTGRILGKGGVGSAKWMYQHQVKAGIGGWMGSIGQGFASGFGEGFRKGANIGEPTKTRPPDSEQYRRNPRAYWNDRGKLVTMLANFEDDYLTALSNVNSPKPLLDEKGQKTGKTREKTDDEKQSEIYDALIQHDKDLLTVAKSAKQKTGSSLKAIQAHLEAIKTDQKGVMPPSTGFPDTFGGPNKRKTLMRNFNRLTQKTNLKRHRLRDASRGSQPATQQAAKGDPTGGVDVNDREYVKEGSPEYKSAQEKGVKIHRGEKRGPTGEQASYYSRREMSSKMNQEKNGGGGGGAQPDPNAGRKMRLDLSNDEEFTMPEEQAQTPNVAVPNGQSTAQPKVQSPAEQRNATIEASIKNEVAQSKQAQQKANARSAKSRAAIAESRAEAAEVDARVAKEKRDEHIADVLSKLDNNIQNIQIKSNPNISEVFKQLEQTIDTLEKQEGLGKGTGGGGALYDPRNKGKKPRERNIDFSGKGKHGPIKTGTLVNPDDPTGPINTNGIEKDGNPFAQLAGRISTEMGKLSSGVQSRKAKKNR